MSLQGLVPSYIARFSFPSAVHDGQTHFPEGQCGQEVCPLTGKVWHEAASWNRCASAPMQPGACMEKGFMRNPALSQQPQISQGCKFADSRTNSKLGLWKAWAFCERRQRSSQAFADQFPSPRAAELGENEKEQGLNTTLAQASCIWMSHGASMPPHDGHPMPYQKLLQTHSPHTWAMHQPSCSLQAGPSLTQMARSIAPGSSQKKNKKNHLSREQLALLSLHMWRPLSFTGIFHREDWKLLLSYSWTSYVPMNIYARKGTKTTCWAGARRGIKASCPTLQEMTNLSQGQDLDVPAIQVPILPENHKFE